MKKHTIYLLMGLLFWMSFSNQLKAQGGVDVIIWLDNSTSISDTEYDNMSATTSEIIESVLNCNPSKNKVSVVHYAATSLVRSSSRIYIESNFTNDIGDALNFTRRTGTANPDQVGQFDYAHEALGLIGNALDGTTNSAIVSPQKTLTRTPGNKLVIFFFTDALRNYGAAPVEAANGTYLVRALGSGGPFDNYNNFKNSRSADFVVLRGPNEGVNSTINASAQAAAAAIASVGGSYSGSVESNTSDPEGSGTKPRLLYTTDSFSLPQSDLDDLIGEICNAGCTASLVITSQPNGANYCQNATATALSVVASGTGNTYQWYRSTTNSTSGGTAVGTNSSTYTPVITNIGTYHYYVVVTNGSCVVKSAVATVGVSSSPSITAQPNGADYCFGTPSAAALSVASSGGTGTISYQWYRNTNNNTTSGTMVGTNSSTYTPVITATGTFYYYVTVKRGTCSVTSNVATVTVIAKPATPVASASTLSNICPFTTANLTTLQPAAVNGQTYEWHSAATNPSAGTLVGNPSAVSSSGTYYLYAKADAGGCFSNASNGVVVTINGCSTCPILMADLLPYNGDSTTEGVFAQNQIKIGTNRLHLINTTALSNQSLFSTNVISDDHYAGEVGIKIGHSKSSGLTYAERITSTLIFDNPMSFLKFTINDIDLGDNVIINAYDENGVLINLGTSNFFIHNVANITRTGNRFYPTSATFESFNLTREGTVDINFNDKKVSKVVFEFYDTISTGSYSISKISGEVCPENNCTKPGNFSPGGTPTKVGITVQQKKENWPGKIPNGFIALESKEKGMVITRVEKVGGGANGAPNLTTDSVKDPKEGMLVYDMQQQCVKLYNGKIWKCLYKNCNMEFMLDCSNVVITGDTVGPNVNFTITIPYMNGDGSTYANQAINSAGLMGLTATLVSGNLANGSGDIVLNVTGTTDNGGSAFFQLTINGSTCILLVPMTFPPTDT